jgi:hypothetical protein
VRSAHLHVLFRHRQVQIGHHNLGRRHGARGLRGSKPGSSPAARLSARTQRTLLGKRQGWGGEAWGAEDKVWLPRGARKLVPVTTQSFPCLDTIADVETRVMEEKNKTTIRALGNERAGMSRLGCSLARRSPAVPRCRVAVMRGPSYRSCFHLPVSGSAYAPDCERKGRRGGETTKETTNDDNNQRTLVYGARPPLGVAFFFWIPALVFLTTISRA